MRRRASETRLACRRGRLARVWPRAKDARWPKMTPWFQSAQIAPPSSSSGRSHRFDAADIEGSAEIVDERGEAEFAAGIVKAAHQEGPLVHPLLDRAEGVLASLTAPVENKLISIWQGAASTRCWASIAMTLYRPRTKGESPPHDGRNHRRREDASSPNPSPAWQTAVRGLASGPHQLRSATHAPPAAIIDWHTWSAAARDDAGTSTR